MVKDQVPPPVGIIYSKNAEAQMELRTTNHSILVTDEDEVL